MEKNIREYTPPAGRFYSRGGFDVEIGSATGNVADLSSMAGKARSVMAGVESMRGFLEETGYAGWEVHPMRGRYLAELLGAAATARFFELDTIEKSSILSTHMSFTSANSSLIERLVMPPDEQSLKTLQAVERAAGAPRDMVVYPDALPAGGVFTDENSTIARRGVQHAAEFWGPRGLIDAEPEYVRYYLGTIGVTHLVPDTFHYRRSSKSDAGVYLRPWQEVLPNDAAAGAIMEVHLALGRSDMLTAEAADHQVIAKSVQELKAAVDGPEAFRRTEAWDMINAVVEHTPKTGPERPKLRIITEVPRAAIDDLNIPFEAAHAQMVHSIAENLRAA